MEKNFINKIYCLTLEKNYERWNILKNKLDNNNVKYHKIFGIDGLKMKMSDIKKECSDLTKHFFITHNMYGKKKSHYLLWKKILETNSNDNEFFIILEDDCILPDNFKNYLDKLNNFIKKIPKHLIEETDLFNLSPTGDYTLNNTLNNNIISYLTKIISLITSKKKYDNSILYEFEEIKLLNSNFPLSTHAYIVNLKQINKLVENIEENKITYHLDIFLNTENFNINSIIPIEIKRGGIEDSVSFSTTNPVFATKFLTLFNKELAYDLSKPLVNIFGLYPLSILILFYLILIIIWQFIDIPGRLDNFFSSI